GQAGRNCQDGEWKDGAKAFGHVDSPGIPVCNRNNFWNDIYKESASMNQRIFTTSKYPLFSWFISG
ncbi:hypothetical protein, partial [Massilia sp. MS-15]|uniref:hypothetical protein n=1 Tax=Massilia sp. MS-15 TaxID=2878200 RepID=UPI001CD64E99